MKKYPVRFVTDFFEEFNENELKEWKGLFYRGPKHFHRLNPGKYEMCKKWREVTEMSLAEVEANISELRQIIFDGETIIIYNDYLE